MTLATPISFENPQHCVLDGVSWDDYTHVLEQIGDGRTQVTFCEGKMEIMPPLPTHENAGLAINALIEVLALERNIPLANFGSTTFRRVNLKRGLEPDKCFYIKNAARVLGMTEFDPAIYPAPDLAIEIDVTRRSIPRLPIHAALGVPEVWRYDRKKLVILHLSTNNAYVTSATSGAFPFLPMDVFESFVHRMEKEMRTNVLRDFQAWVRKLAPLRANSAGGLGRCPAERCKAGHFSLTVFDLE
jgi:Uma2 family endonuclease